ncbi:hypothetical protein BJ170DRAFT_726577 [Xylariales sp. AK1849]|nr:hypothetical protein BJ170DRAFT_726577 [Xylariales sp. AK1849]
MITSRLLYYALLIRLAATSTRSFAEDEFDIHGGLVGDTQTSQKARTVIRERVEYVVVEKEVIPRRAIPERTPEPTSTATEGAKLVVRIPVPTAAPRRRQDDGQVQALSGQIQRLSTSFSSVSSASQAISQSLQQVQQSADQAAQDASRVISQTLSSASSAVQQASQQANSRIAQASSSMSSQISQNLASVQSSASSAVSVAQAQASSSMASALDVAASQVQAARADATAVRGDASNFADQVQRNAVSTTNLAIIVAVSVSGAVILTSVIACLLLRYRRKKRHNRAVAAAMVDEKDYGKPVAVRDSPGSGSRFNPWGGGTYPMDKLKLPAFSPRSAKKVQPESLNFGFATSDYSDLKGKSDQKRSKDAENQDVYGVSPTSFRLQKPPSIKSAESVRLIRVNSTKNKEVEASKPEDPPVPPVQPGPPPPVQQREAQVSRKPITSEKPKESKRFTLFSGSEASTKPRDNSRNTVTLEASTKPRGNSRNTMAPEASTKPRDNSRNTMALEASTKPRDNSRNTMASEASTKPRQSVRASVNPFATEPPMDSKRFTMATEVSEEPGWRPPNRTSRAATTMSTAQRLAFRDSGDLDPDVSDWRQPRGFSMASVSNLMRSQSRRESSELDRQPTVPKLPKVTRSGPSFATFPTVRNGPPSMMGRPRPALAAKVREDTERRMRDIESRSDMRSGADLSKPQR